MSTNPDRILRLKAVLAQTGLCRSTLYRKMVAGTFPKNIQLSTQMGANTSRIRGLSISLTRRSPILGKA